MIFETESGSTYELDQANKRVRRLNGKTLGTKRLGTDGTWRPYKDISEPRVGWPVVIMWNDDVPPVVAGTEPPTDGKQTHTSYVVAVLA